MQVAGPAPHVVDERRRRPIEAVHERFHQEAATRRCSLRHRAALRLIHGERLLAQDVFSGLERRDYPLPV